MILCACGCGEEIEPCDSRGRPHKYIRGHSNRNPSPERRKNISNSQKGEKNGFYGKHHSEESNQINREKHLGKPLPHTKAWNENISQSLLGNNSPNWKGGINSINNTIRNLTKYSNWRTQIFGRDNFTCQECGVRGVWLEAHHKKPFYQIIEEYKIETTEQAIECSELWSVDNGITLCGKCHNKIPTKMKIEMI